MEDDLLKIKIKNEMIKDKKGIKKRITRFGSHATARR